MKPLRWRTSWMDWKACRGKIKSLLLIQSPNYLLMVYNSWIDGNSKSGYIHKAVLYLARLFVLGMNYDTDQEGRSNVSVLLKLTNLLQKNSGCHTMRKAQGSAGSKYRKSNWIKASYTAVSQDFSDSQPQNLEEGLRDVGCNFEVLKTNLLNQDP